MGVGEGRPREALAVGFAVLLVVHWVVLLGGRRLPLPAAGTKTCLFWSIQEREKLFVLPAGSVVGCDVSYVNDYTPTR